jgi:hypothetical protein
MGRASAHSFSRGSPSRALASPSGGGAYATKLGWTTLEPWLLEAAGLDDLERQEIVDGLVSMAMRVLGREDEEERT